MRVQILGAIIASAIVLGLVFEDDRDHNPLGANTYQHRPGMTRTRAFGGTPPPPPPPTPARVWEFAFSSLDSHSMLAKEPLSPV